MKNQLCRYFALILFFLPVLVYGKDGAGEQSGMAGGNNYSTFTAATVHRSAEGQIKNKGYEQDPEIGLLFNTAPCANCYELIGKRTEISKTYIREGSDGRDIMQQTSTGAMHYHDGSGQWRTIVPQLQPGSTAGVYEAPMQPVPVSIAMAAQYCALGKDGAAIQFNDQLELLFAGNDGNIMSLGNADWNNYTAGNDGIYITNAWAGIDVELHVIKGAIKTNFYINYAMPEYANGKLLIRDHLKLGSGYKLSINSRQAYTGNIAVRDRNGTDAYLISAATAWQHSRERSTLQMLEYAITGDTLDIAIPGDLMNKAATAYPVTIDPLVTAVTTSAVGGATYSAGMTTGCSYLNIATVPANVTVTDVQWTFAYVASGGAGQNNGGADYTLGSCRSPAPGFFHACSTPGGGTCSGTSISIFSAIAGCIPPPQCTAYPLNITMKLYQNFAATAPCASTYITAGSNLTITVSGRTVEATSISAAGGVSSVCNGGSVTFTANASNGVPPYTYAWAPGGVIGNPATLIPAGTTTYTGTVTDACGNAATATRTVTVNPIAPISGANSICTGTTTTLSNSSGAGTWSSANPAVAAIGSSSGIVTGVSPGTSIITFTTSGGCFTTTTVTIAAPPAPITGALSVCMGANTSLSSATPGGVWSSAPAAIATIGTASGIAGGVSAGTATITYTTLAGCKVNAVLTVLPLPHISGISYTDPTGCGNANGSIVLNGLTAGAAYTLYYLSGTLTTTTATANSTGHIIISGLAAGSYANITVISAAGCISNVAGPVTLSNAPNPAMPVLTNNSPLCEGGVIHFTAVSDPGVSYSWSGPGGFTSTEQNPFISPATPAIAGTYSVVAALLGCVSTASATIVVVNPVPHAAAIKSADPATCAGHEGAVTITGLTAGMSYTFSYTKDGIPVWGTRTADGGGDIVITGLGEGDYANFLVTAGGCTSAPAGPVLLKDPIAPPPPVISSNMPICVGLALQFNAADDVAGGTYSWAGPNGYTSTEQNPIIPNIPFAGQGIYTLMYTYHNCTSVNVGAISLFDGVKLSAITASAATIESGDSIQLQVSGAAYYIWSPQNGSLNDDFIHDPIAKPKDSITEYTVYGMNEYGCRDSAKITLQVRYDEIVIVPNAFSPNGDGLNDVFRVGKMYNKKMLDFTVYDRWGKEMYHNAYDPNGGWDGTYNGRKQDVGVYYYSILIESANGKSRLIKGDVTLLR